MAQAETALIAADELLDFVTQMFEAVGCSADNARIVATGFVEADLRGHALQGIDHMVHTLRALERGRLDGKARPAIVRESAATALVDGHAAPGHVGAAAACDVAIAKARQSGAGVVGLVSAGDVYMMGLHVGRIVEAGMAGLAFSNSYDTDVHPTGGIDPLIGTNPIAFGFPTGDGPPVIIDFATSASAQGHIRISSYYDRAIPAGIALDQDGAPTTDPHRALKGAISPMAGHKGFALGLSVALISGPLISALIGRELTTAMETGRQIGKRGHTFIAIDPGAFGDAAMSKASTSRFLDEIRASRKAPGVDRIFIPGERAAAARARALRDGVTVDAKIWEHTIELANHYGVAIPATKPGPAKQLPFTN